MAPETMFSREGRREIMLEEEERLKSYCRASPEDIEGKVSARARYPAPLLPKQPPAGPGDSNVTTHQQAVPPHQGNRPT